MLCSFLILSSCAGDYLGQRPSNSHYCDNFLIYDMCIQDSDRDGIVEFTYFEDSREVFMYREGADKGMPADLSLHRCATMMDDELVEISSRIFYINDDSSLMERTDIRGALMLKYMAWLPDVAACNLRAERQAQEADDT